MSRPIYICLAADDNYAQLAEVAIVSIMENNIQATDIEIFLLDSGISLSKKENIKKTVHKYKRKIQYLDVSNKINELKQLGMNSQSVYNSYGAYARFFIVGYLPSYVDKILYIDCDVCANGSLDELFKLDLKENVVGAVKDILPSFHNLHINFALDDNYYCSGVLLINVKSWKEKRIEESIINHINNTRAIYSYHDQDLINIICKNYIYTLHPRYMVFLPEYRWGAEFLKKLGNIKNYYDNEDIKNAANNPILIHFVDSIEGRPWHKINYNQNSSIWEKYKDNTISPSSFVYQENKFSKIHKLCVIISKTVFNTPLQIILNYRRMNMVHQRDIEADFKWNKMKGTTL